MNPNPPHEPGSRQRLGALLSTLLDGELTADEFAELQSLLTSSPAEMVEVVDHLLLDALLDDEVGPQTVAALIDVVAEVEPEPRSVFLPVEVAAGGSPGVPGEARQRPPGETVVRGPVLGTWRRLLAGVSLVALLGLGVVLFQRQATTALAKPASLIRAAGATHAQAVERVYLVSTERLSATPDGGVAREMRDVRVMTLGNRFYVEMNRGQRRLVWGRNDDNGVWICLGARQAVIVEPDEIGAPLEYLANLYSLNLESLLESFLRNCDLQRQDSSSATHVIEVLPRWPMRGRWLRSALIEIDRETKVVRRLTIERETPQQGSQVITFQLVDSRVAEETRYRPEGHLAEPFQLLTRHSQPDQRRELLRGWFSPLSERWIKTPGADSR